MSKQITGNGIQAQYQRSQNGALARVVYRNARAVKVQTAARQRLPELMGASTQDTISWLLGVRPAHAAEPVRTQAALPGESGKSTLPGDLSGDLPGALGLPQDPQALIDHRYLSDTAGNLLFAQGKSSLGNRPDSDVSQTSYAYDSRDRLIVASQGQGTTAAQPAAVSAPTQQASLAPGGTSTNISRYYYSQGRRVLAREAILEAQDLKTGTRKMSYQPGIGVRSCKTT